MYVFPTKGPSCSSDTARDRTRAVCAACASAVFSGLCYVATCMRVLCVCLLGICSQPGYRLASPVRLLDPATPNN